MALYFGISKGQLPGVLSDGIKLEDHPDGLRLPLYPKDAQLHGPIVLQLDLATAGRISPEELSILWEQDIPASKVRVMPRCAGCGALVDPDVITCQSCANELSARMMDTRREG